jgi:serine/threonine protein phosphatase PrpC
MSVEGMIPDQDANKDKPARSAASFDTVGVPAALTDTGCDRLKNEDRFLVLKGALGMGYFVFDGMGGEAGGEAAAQLSLDTVRSYFEGATESDPAQALRDSIQSAHDVIALRRQNPKLASMGTTVVAALCSGSQVIIGSVGDSRAYYISGGNARQLTSDHTFVQQLVDQGLLRAEEALTHPHSHILTRCLGSAVGFDIDIHKFWLAPSVEERHQGSMLLCSDGLYSLVTEPDLAAIVVKYSPLEACTKLIELARERGGYDNITAIVIPLTGELREETGPPSEELDEALNPQVLKPDAFRPRNRQVPLSFHLKSVGVVTFALMVLTVAGFLFFMMRVD